MKSILLTLGHNSSAIFVEVNPRTMIQSKPLGYEEERLNKIKSSSAFPKLAIEKIIEQVDITGATVYISHWFDNFYEPLLQTNKYYDAEYMANLMATYDLKFVCLNETFTHHDAHAFSAYSFLRNFATTTTVKDSDFHYIVADGFGNNQEVLSIYKSGSMGQPELILRLNGYENSLGLMYQYATSFCGMKENQDEYKFLGYEAKIQSVLNPHKLEVLESCALDLSKHFMSELLEAGIYSKDVSKSKDLINIEDLQAAKKWFYDTFEYIISQVSVAQRSEYEKRIIIGYLIQYTIEHTFKQIIHELNIENVCLAGGVFYNVKLNNMIAKTVKGFTSINPLAGDQGAAIGLYEAVAGNFRFHDLCYGKRDLSLRKSVVESNDANYIVCADKSDFTNVITDLIKDGNIVNIVHSEMEFGPRALCNTSTIALPTIANVDYINRVNKRNTVMPMAPVVLSTTADLMFDETLDKVIGSNRFMICTHDFDKHYKDLINIRGVQHVYPTTTDMSGRPQVLSFYEDHPVRDVLVNLQSEYGTKCLINTSFNTHGTPILYSLDDCVTDFAKQRENDTENRIYLVVLENEI